MSEKQKILIVDDKRANLVALGQVLAELDADVVSAKSGNEALTASLDHTFSLAILDVQMPGMDGYELAGFLRGDPKTEKLPIIFLTAAFGEESHIYKGYEAGAVDYIIKPYTPSVLLSKARIFLDLQRAQKDLALKMRDLAISEDRYRTLVSTIPDIVYRLNGDGKFLYLNDAIRSIGYLPEELIGQPFARIIHPRDIKKVCRFYVLPKIKGKSTDDTGSPKLFDERRTGLRQTLAMEVRLIPGRAAETHSGVFESYDQNIIFAEVSSSGLYSRMENHAFLGTVGVIRNITQRKEVESELMRYREHLEEKVKKRTAKLSKANEKLQREVKERRLSDEALAREQAELSATLYSMGDAVISADADGRVVRMNPAAEKLTEWMESDGMGRPLGEVFKVVSGKKSSEDAPPKKSVSLMDRLAKETCETMLVSRYGQNVPITKAVAPIVHGDGKKNGVVIVFKDQTEAHLTRQFIEIRLSLIEYAISHTLEAFLSRALDEVGAFVNSPIGFYHFVEPDQKTLSLQQWSTRTLEEFCTAHAKERHYAIDAAGIWVSCVHKRKPVIHNDYASHPHKKGLPEGHAAIIRELVVPVMREDKVVAILGVGNKPVHYTEKDAEIVSYLADVTWEIVERKKVEASLKMSEEQIQSIVETAMDGIVTIDEKGRVVGWNKGAESIFQYTEAEMKGAFLDKLIPMNLSEKHTKGLERVGINGERHLIGRTVELSALRKDSSEFPIELSLATWVSGKARFYTGIIRDISKRKYQEDQLRQAQKLESVGRLAGGVAHDFNNMLSVIIGYSEEILDSLPRTDPLHDAANETLMAGKRSAMLTRQLLAFSRKQTLQPEVLDINGTIRDLEKMMHRLIGEDLELTFLPSETPCFVEVDPGQIEQVIMNLAVNARDAMPNGGKLTIETCHVMIDDAYALTHMNMPKGKYVLLAISDTGCGMDAFTKEHLFEPFFTTKEKGKGTGLGLSTVYGIVKQSGGYIWPYSEPLKGTTFKVYLPEVSEKPEQEKKQVSEKVCSLKGEAVILVVEDETSMRKLIKRMLDGPTYQVVTAENGDEALLFIKERGLKPDLLITDVVMPGMSGRELSKQLSTLLPDLKILFMSGYTDDAIVHHGVLASGTPFLQKPFNLSELKGKVEALLECGEA